MKNENTAEIDFDSWAELARTDPDAFEARRLAAIDALIASAPEANRERLRCLQWRIDQERRLARTPMAACIRISRMMWRSVLGENGLQQRFAELQELVNGSAPLVVDVDRGARVVAFARGAE